VAFNAPLPKRASAERSTVPLVFGVCSMVLAVASFLAMLVFLVLLNVSNLPNRSVLEGIWRTPGFSLPIRQPVFLQRAGLNWIYLDTLESDLTKDDTIDIVLTDPRGRQVLVNPLSLEGFHKGNRELLPKGAFFVPAPGAYVLQIGPGAPGASIKIGPPTQVGSSVLARFNEGLAIAAGGFMIVFGTTGFFLLRRGYSGPRSRDKRALTARA
jgi:hypothetical protein